ncbi:unnamed protein product [Paramecium pentaurelia]|uniref:RING-CH-type domain-containing protein n=1 Tax=Paramecium pentaurelia TaxID=43138 RepID=A0A8S1SKB1_9CILI|nr:unnamed protein product [Paramecium pentaurelia]
MDTTGVHNQAQAEIFEQKLITIQGTSSLPTEHVYRVRKQLHPQITANQFHLNKTQNSSLNCVNLFCQFCNKSTSVSTGRYCGCSNRQFHQSCLLNHINQGFRQGNGIMQCSYCNLYYPTEVESKLSLQNLTKSERVKYFLMLLIIFIIIVIEILITLFLNLNTILYVILAVLWTCELLILILLIRRIFIQANYIKFSFKEYRFGDEIIQFIYAQNSFKIIQALKFGKAKQLYLN